MDSYRHWLNSLSEERKKELRSVGFWVYFIENICGIPKEMYHEEYDKLAYSDEADIWTAAIQNCKKRMYGDKFNDLINS